MKIKEILFLIFSEVTCNTSHFICYNANMHRERFLEKSDFYNNQSVILFGDSQIACWRIRRYFGWLPIRNRGKNGDRADTALKRMKKDVLRFCPKTVVILIGTNDIARKRRSEEVAGDIYEMISILQKNGIKAIVCSVLPVRGIYRNSRPLVELEKLNKLIYNMADQHKFNYLDFWPSVTDNNEELRSDLTYDGLHLNSKGYLILTSILIDKF